MPKITEFDQTNKLDTQDVVFKLLWRNMKNQERSRTKKDWKAKIWWEVCYVWERNQMQTRMDAEIVVYSKAESEARWSEIQCTKTIDKRVVNQIRNQNQ